jgi:hypothetical protein
VALKLVAISISLFVPLSEHHSTTTISSELRVCAEQAFVQTIINADMKAVVFLKGRGAAKEALFGPQLASLRRSFS